MVAMQGLEFVKSVSLFRVFCALEMLMCLYYGKNSKNRLLLTSIKQVFLSSIMTDCVWVADASGVAH